MRQSIMLRDRKILRLLLEGKSPKEIAVEFNLHVQSITATVHRKGFKNLSDFFLNNVEKF